MDKLYIGDIPSDFKYAVFSNDYVTLYNKNGVRNETIPFYRIYFNAPGFFYSTGSTTVGNTTQYYQELNVTDDIMYRKDYVDIVTVSFIFMFGIVLLFNLVTSVFKSGGLLGGLL